MQNVFFCFVLSLFLLEIIRSNQNVLSLTFFPVLSDTQLEQQVRVEMCNLAGSSAPLWNVIELCIPKCSWFYILAVRLNLKISKSAKTHTFFVIVSPLSSRIQLNFHVMWFYFKIIFHAALCTQQICGA